jgi:hypothetical protein
MSARSRRDTHRCEPAVRERADRDLGLDLGLAVRRDRVERGLLVEVAVGAGAVQAARRREHVAADARGLGRFGQIDRRVQVDVVGEVGVEIAERIVGQCAEVDHGVEPAQLIRRDVAQVEIERGDLVGRRPEVAVVEVAGVEPDHVEPCLAQHGDELDADVPSVTGDQNTHGGHYNRILRP